MPNTNESSDRIEKLARRSWWAALVGAGGLLVFVLSLGFGSYYLNRLAEKVKTYQETADSLRETADSLDAVVTLRMGRIGELRGEENSLRREIDSLQALIAGVEETVQTTGQQPTAWIQVANEAQHEDARRMGGLLKQKQFGGFRVPGIETVERLPKNKQIRVFNAKDMELAKRVRDSLGANGFEGFIVKDLSDRYDMEPGILEFWFASPE